jgi:hypothetical protein
MSPETPQTFVDRSLAGFADLDDIEDEVEAWANAGGPGRVYDYLGMTRQEYGLWVEQPSALRFILFSRRFELLLEEVFTSDVREAVMARAASPDEARTVAAWLMETGRLKR